MPGVLVALNRSASPIACLDGLVILQEDLSGRRFLDCNLRNMQSVCMISSQYGWSFGHVTIKLAVIIRMVQSIGELSLLCSQ